MDIKFGFIVACSLLVSVVKESNAVTCYACDSVYQINCHDEFNHDGINTTECSDGCIKIKVANIGNSGAWVVRGCRTILPSLALLIGRGCDNEYYEGQRAHFCQCNRDLCNMASPMKISEAKLIVVFVLVLIRIMVL